MASLFLAYGSKIWAKGKPSYEKKNFLSDFWVKNSLGRFGPVLKNFPDNDFVLNRFLDNFQKRFQRCMTCKRYIFLHLGVLPTYCDVYFKVYNYIADLDLQIIMNNILENIKTDILFIISIIGYI